MFPFSVLTARSLLLIELAVSSVLDMTYLRTAAPFHHQRDQGCELAPEGCGNVRRGCAHEGLVLLNPRACIDTGV